MKNKCVILCYLYNLDRLSDILALAHNCNLPIFLTLSTKYKDDKKLHRLLKQQKCLVSDIHFQENYGVDIAPFLQQINLIDSSEFPYFIKIHSKASYWGVSNHVDWGTVLIDSLIGNPKTFFRNLKIINRRNVGMIGPQNLLIRDQEGFNAIKIQFLCDYLGIDYAKLHPKHFIAGSMFMGTTSVFQNCFNQDIVETFDSFLQNERGKIDDIYHVNGTFCHAIERLFGYIMPASNLSIHTSAVDTLRIYNKTYRTVHLHITYNNFCYLTEDINIYGKIVSRNRDFIKIEWLHLQGNPVVKYMYTNGNSLSVANSKILS